LVGGPLAEVTLRPLARRVDNGATQQGGKNMRAIIAAIAVVLAIGAVMPTDVDARAPRKVEKWGCTFKAHLGLDTGTPPTVPWVGAGDLDCDEKVTLNITMAVLQDTPGAPDRLVNTDTWRRMQYGPGGRQDGQTVFGGGGFCTQTGPPAYPFYFRMKVERTGLPGAAWVASHNPNPCARYDGWPYEGLPPEGLPY
jgi:hypothetical protein